MTQFKAVFKKTILPFGEKILLFLSFMLLILFLLEFFVDHGLNIYYQYLYSVLWFIFLLEYSVKILFSQKKLHYILDNPFGLLIIVFPFIRPLSLLPVSRFGLLILSEQVMKRLPWLRKYRVLELLLLTIIITIFSADLFLIFERDPTSNIRTFSDAVWFSISTVSTVGYGDLYPRTIPGRILATILLIFGVSIFGAITANIATYFINSKVKKEMKSSDEKIHDISLEEKRVEKMVEKIYVQEKKIEDKLEELKKTNT